MGSTLQDKDEYKAALKALRQERAETIARVRARLKEQKRDLAGIKAELAGQPRTVPQIAQATGLPADRVLWYVTALRKYGQAAEGDQAGGYFYYELIEDGQDPAQDEAED